MAMASFSGRVTSAATGRSLNNVRIMIDSSPHEVVDIAALSWGDGDFELDLPPRFSNTITACQRH